MTYLLLVVSIFVAAYGNAMNRRVYRRKALISSGRVDTPEMSKAYDRTGTVVFAIGVLGMVAALVLVVMGNPVALLANR